MINDLLIVQRGCCEMRLIPSFNQHQNALIQGGNLEVMTYLLKEGYRGKFNMIYFDGPFNSGLVFSLQNKEQDFSYIDPWAELETLQHYFDREAYLESYRKRMELARELLHEDGMFVLQTNQLSGHHVKVLIDHVFGSENFLSEVIWKHSEVPWGSPYGSPIGYQHEMLLFYRKSPNWSSPVSANYPSVWDDISGYSLDSEDTQYPSQKPELLLERIIDITSCEGELIGDFYCGSGTFPYVASKKKRRWVACDNNSLSIEITNKRLQGMRHLFQLYRMVDDFCPHDLTEKEYTKTSKLPLSVIELEGLPREKRWEVNAYCFLPEVDLYPDKEQLCFHYLFPLLTKKGYDDQRVIKIPRPIPQCKLGQYNLLVPQPFEWIFYHLVHLETNEFNMINVTKYEKNYERAFDWEKINQSAKEIVKKIQNQWIREIIEHTDYVELIDLLGYRYYVSR